MIIDLDADPYVPDDWTVVEHKKGGRLDLAKSKVVLISARIRKSMIPGEGYGLLTGLHAPPVLNANALDFFLTNPHLIPQEWKEKRVCFWGTSYRCNGDLVVRYLYRYSDKWHWNYYSLDELAQHLGRQPSAACAQADPFPTFDADEIVC